ncbi:MAG: four helix bundle protein [Ignavibacteria bacterium]
MFHRGKIWINKPNKKICCIYSPNIAEGAGRNTKGEFKNFLGVANGSLFELEIQLIISKDMNYLKDYNLNLLLPKIDMLQKMIYNSSNLLNNN